MIDKRLLRLLDIFCEGQSDTTIKFFYEEYKENKYVLKGNNQGKVTVLEYFNNNQQLYEFLAIHL